MSAADPAGSVTEQIDALFLRQAIKLAEAGMFSVTANPRVGCIIVRDGAVLGRGAHLRAGDAHAEALAIDDAGGDVRGATVYVSLEPCAIVGRTPACASTLIEMGVARVVCPAEDPHPQVAGRGFAMLVEAGVEVVQRAMPAARRLNYAHERLMRRGWPYVRIKVAQSLDGRTAMADGTSKWITSADARADVQYWRARSGAIITGIGTLLADDPVLCGFRGPKLQIKRLFISRFNAAVLCQVIGVVDDCREKFGWGGWFVANVKMTDFIG